MLAFSSAAWASRLALGPAAPLQTPASTRTSTSQNMIKTTGLFPLFFSFLVILPVLLFVLFSFATFSFSYQCSVSLSASCPIPLILCSLSSGHACPISLMPWPLLLVLPVLFMFCLTFYSLAFQSYVFLSFFSPCPFFLFPLLFFFPFFSSYLLLTLPVPFLLCLALFS